MYQYRFRAPFVLCRAVDHDRGVEVEAALLVVIVLGFYCGGPSALLHDGRLARAGFEDKFDRWGSAGRGKALRLDECVASLLELVSEALAQVGVNVVEVELVEGLDGLVDVSGEGVHCAHLMCVWGGSPRYTRAESLERGLHAVHHSELGEGVSAEEDVRDARDDNEGDADGGLAHENLADCTAEDDGVVAVEGNCRLLTDGGVPLQVLALDMLGSHN